MAHLKKHVLNRSMLFCYLLTLTNGQQTVVSMLYDYKLRL